MLYFSAPKYNMVVFLTTTLVALSKALTRGGRELHLLEITKYFSAFFKHVLELAPPNARREVENPVRVNFDLA